MPLLAYVALCLVVPAAWGVAMYRVFDWLARRRAERVDPDEPTPELEEHPPIDYSI